MSQSHRNIAGSLVLSALLSTTCLGKQPERIVSVGGTATEIVCALGAGDRLVAVDLSSIYPPEVRELPQVGYIRSISPEGILSLRPDLVVTTESFGPPPAKDMMRRQRSIPVIWCPEPESVAALETSIQLIAEQLGNPERGEAIISSVHQDLEQATARSSTWAKPPRVLFFLQAPTASTGGLAAGQNTAANALIRLSGGDNASNQFANYQTLSPESILQINPDVILVALSDSHGGTPESLDALRKLDSLASVRAFQRGAVHGVPLDDLHFGPRLGEAVLRWNALIAPE